MQNLAQKNAECVCKTLVWQTFHFSFLTNVLLYLRSNLLNFMTFATKTPSLKHLKPSNNFLRNEVEKLFGLCVNKNGYHYCFNDNMEFIKCVEGVWMIMHQFA